MLYMVIETFHPQQVKELYQRVEEKGRLLPPGVQYINSWIDEDIKTCYQVMESETKEKLLEWVDHWIDLADFQVIPVLTSAQAKEKAKEG
jgi:hypothetical protein